MELEEFAEDVETEAVATENVEAEDADIEAPLDEDASEIEDLGEEDGEGEDLPPVDRPRSWRKDEAESWDDLPRDVQEVLVRREQDIAADLSRRQNEFAEQQKKLQGEFETIKQERTQLYEFAQKVRGILEPPDETLDDPDHENYDPESFKRQKRSYDAKVKLINDAEGEVSKTSEEDVRKFQAEQTEIYKKDLPELMNPKTGKEVADKLVSYASKTLGMPADKAALLLAKNATAQEVITLYKASLWDEAKAKSKGMKQKREKPAAKSLPAGNTKKSADKSLEDILYS